MSEKNLEKKLEQSKESCGRNIEVSIFLIRHGKKEESGMLSELGKKESALFGQKLEKGAIKGYVSDLGRVRQTAEKIIEASKASKKLKMREKYELSAPSLIVDKDKSKFFAPYSPRLKEIFNLPSSEREGKIEELEREMVKEWLSYEDKRPDEGTASPYEVAKNLAKLFDLYLRMADRLKSESRVDLVNVTHEFMIGAFAKYFLAKKEGKKIIKGKELMEKLGWRIDYLSGVEARVKINENGEKTLRIFLDGKEYDLLEENIKKMLSENNENIYEYPKD